jgi:hypothetical protein
VKQKFDSRDWILRCFVSACEVSLAMECFIHKKIKIPFIFEGKRRDLSH